MTSPVMERDRPPRRHEVGALAPTRLCPTKIYRGPPASVGGTTVFAGEEVDRFAGLTAGRRAS
jgi:hypothetical protein